MARPKKNNADYFSHDADMRNDPKIRALRRKYGFMGYAIWLYLLEVLTDSDFFQVHWNDMSIELLSGDFDCEVAELKCIVEYCVNLKLFEIQDSMLFSFNHQKRFEGLLMKRKRQINFISTSKNSNRGVSDVENPQSKIKNSKADNSKVKAIQKGIGDTTPFSDSPKGELSSSANYFSFEKSLMELGVNKQLAKDWIKVRKVKKATNTETAFKAVKEQFRKSGKTAAECVQIAVENSWKGFRAEWISGNMSNDKFPIGYKHYSGKSDLSDLDF